MKILIISTSETEGGAARAALRLHNALLENNFDSTMLVQSKQTDNYTVIGPKNKIDRMMGIMRPIFEQLILRNKNNSGNLFSTSKLSNKNILKKIREINPDIINIHWFQNGCLSIEDLAKINKPIIFTLHDNWLYTGGCHISFMCSKYKDICQNCPSIKGRVKKDISYNTFKRKKRFFEKINFSVITLSNFVTIQAKESFLLKNKTITCLGNPINTEIFKPITKRNAREILNLPLNEKIILFGAMNPIKDMNKGADLLFETLNMDSQDNYSIIIIGASKTKQTFLKQKTYYYGFVHDDYTLSLLYNAADIVIVPSRQENLSNMIMESLSCGTPVLAFDVGGNSDMIDHRKNGYLAEPFSTIDLHIGLHLLLSTKSQDSLLIHKNIALKYSYSNIVKKIIPIYKESIGTI